MVGAGCLGDYRQGPEGGISDDLGSSDAIGQLSSTPPPNGVIVVPQDYLTLRPGGAVTFRGQVFCPAAIGPCTYRWSFGNGQTATAKDPGKIVFGKVGYYPVTFTVTDRSGKADPTPSVAHVAVWNGKFSDDFNRTKIDYVKSGLRPPLLVTDTPMYDISSNQLHITGSWGLPGSTAITAWPQVRNLHLEVVKKRQTDTKTEHYSDIILRMHPTNRIGKFYRVRFWEENAPDSGVEIAIFRISDPSDEHGVLLSDPTQPPSTGPTVCKGCHYIQNYPRTQDLKIIVDIWESKFYVRIEDPKKPGVAVLKMTAADPLPGPYLYAGAVGLTHFEGISYFDSLVFNEISKDPGGATPDGGATAPDAGVP